LGRYKLPKPMWNSGDLDFSFSGLKTAVMTTLVRDQLTAADFPDLARDVEHVIVQVLIRKSTQALEQTGLKHLVVAGGVSANLQLREQLQKACLTIGGRAYFPAPALCSDNGAMIAFAAAMRIKRFGLPQKIYGFDVKPRWPLEELRNESGNE
jgi:N6-L-threonylcarbamoyladenine synthase